MFIAAGAAIHLITVLFSFLMNCMLMYFLLIFSLKSAGALIVCNAQLSFLSEENLRRVFVQGKFLNWFVCTF
jgi:hypothetical protein